KLKKQGLNVVGVGRGGVKPKTNIDEFVKTNYSEESLKEILNEFSPSVIYNFAGQSFVGKSWELIDSTISSSTLLVGNLLRAIVCSKIDPAVLNASSSEVYADKSLKNIDDYEKLHEGDLMRPSTPY